MGTDAASGWILGEIERNLPVPLPSPIENIKPDEGEEAFVSLLLLDLNEYAKKYGKQMVQEEIKIPAYLRTFAKEQHIDLSAKVSELLTASYSAAIHG
jgi:hypothetical protein